MLTHDYIIQSDTYQLRDESVTRQLAAIEDEGSEEHKAMKEAMKQRMIDMIRKEDEENPEFRKAALKVVDLEDWDMDMLWFCITYWFQNDNSGLKLPSDQIWVID
jgi:3'-phosphoadenosine 5'-phosphosulfate sulfotransferase (PAPS reductase)/FAD synthetase